MRHQSLAVLVVGMIILGSLLLAAGTGVSSTLPTGFTLLWSQGLLATGFSLGIWLVLEFDLRR